MPYLISTPPPPDRIHDRSHFTKFAFCSGDWGAIIIIEKNISGAKKTRSANREARRGKII